MFYEGLLEALLAQSPLRWRANRSWCSYGVLKKGSHNVFGHHANLVFSILQQAHELTRPSVENIRRGSLLSKPKSSSDTWMYEVSARARARRARRLKKRGGRLSSRTCTGSKSTGRSFSGNERIPGRFNVIFSTLYVSIVVDVPAG